MDGDVAFDGVFGHETIVPRGRVAASVGVEATVRARGKLSGMQLLVPVDDESDACIRLNPALVATFFVRRFSDKEGPARAGSVVTAVVISPTRESKHRLTPRLSHDQAETALDDLGRLLVTDVSGVISWNGEGWAIDRGLV